jgi:rhodanese-related sulfurtransferase
MTTFQRTLLNLTSPLLLLIMIWSPPIFAADIPTLTPADAAAHVADGTAVLIDVREAAEWNKTGVVATAHLLAMSDLRGKRTQWKAFLEAHRDKELILYCAVGGRSAQAAQLLAAEGFRVANAGGFKDWVAAGQPARKASEPRQAP